MPIAAVRHGEALPQELEELFLEHCPMVHRTAYAITGHRQDAEDVLQSIFVKLLQRGLTPEVRQHAAGISTERPSTSRLTCSGPESAGGW